MAEGYPYVQSGGPIVAIVAQLRRSFPKEVTKETLQKLGIAPKNESYLINVLRFLNIIDEEGKKVSSAENVFVEHVDEQFHKAFGKLVEKSYAGLFELYSEGAWDLSNEELIQFFRSSDKSSETVGKRQAITFKSLASFSGHGDMPIVKKSVSNGSTAVKKKVKKTTKSAKATVSLNEPPTKAQNNTGGTSVGLTVRIEVNLPASGDQTTYDRIFSSIRKNFIDGC